MFYGCLLMEICSFNPRRAFTMGQMVSPLNHTAASKGDPYPSGVDFFLGKLYNKQNK